MPKEEKVRLVELLEKEISGSQALLLTDYRGLSVADITALRRKLQESGAEYRVVKNTLFRRAAQEVSVSGLTEMLEGPTAVAFVRDDPVATAKVLVDFIKEHKVPVIKGAYVEGQIISPSQVEDLAKIPPRPVLYAQMLGAMQSPISNLAGILHAMMSNLVYTLQSICEKKAA